LDVIYDFMFSLDIIILRYIIWMLFMISISMATLDFSICPKYGVCLLCKVEKKINFEGEEKQKCINQF
jgi:hypothetical protein